MSLESAVVGKVRAAIAKIPTDIFSAGDITKITRLGGLAHGLSQLIALGEIEVVEKRNGRRTATYRKCNRKVKKKSAWKKWTPIVAQVAAPEPIVMDGPTRSRFSGDWMPINGQRIRAIDESPTLADPLAPRPASRKGAA